jgi:hypothetical protein
MMKKFAFKHYSTVPGNYLSSAYLRENMRETKSTDASLMTITTLIPHLFRTKKPVTALRPKTISLPLNVKMPVISQNR